MKKCELCRHLARMYCESDRASLCYDCDEKVHSANFLVAKHSRTLLCRKCQTPTPWTASGVKLGRAVSVCVSCVDNGSSHAKTHSSSVLENHGRKDDLEFDQDEDDGEYSESGGEEQEEVDEEDEDGENQVVPWSSSSPSPPPSASSSSSDEFSSSRFSSGGVSGLKRTREDAILDYENDTGCSSERVHGDTAETEIMSFRSSENNEGTSVRSFKPVKVIRSKRVREEKSKSSEEIINSLKRLRQGTIADDDN